MYVNKCSLLPAPSFRDLKLYNVLRCCLTTIGQEESDSVPTRFLNCTSVPVAASYRKCTINKLYLSNTSCRHMSRYSASTIMRPHSKAFNFNDYDVVGFDLDGTVLRYNLAEMVPLEYKLLSQYLIEHKKYSNNLLRSLAAFSDKDFLQKGLFLDAEKGNILKLSSAGYILRANHGTKAMNDKDIEIAYGSERQWTVARKFIEDPMCAWNGPLSEKMRSLLDYFDISTSLLFAHAVDDVDARRQVADHGKPYTVWPDILEALIRLYTRENFSNDKSEYFKELKNNPDRYLLKTSPVVLNWLKSFKASNKRLFLLTGSNVDFANFTASYALGENWQDLFDVVICFARKPGFFNASRPFYRTEGLAETDAVPLDCDLEINSIYSMGNWEQLLKLFANKIGKDPGEILSLYVGDNLIQDVYAPVVLSNIDSVAVSEEMLAECSTDESYCPREFEYADLVGSNYWDSYFYEDREPTLWTDIISKYSKMCVPTLDHVATKPIDYQYYIDNECGFYPLKPAKQYAK